MSIQVFVEGGGDRRSHTACRKAFSALFDKLLGNRPKPRIIASGSGDQAYRDFCRSLADDAKNLPLLLVDSEGPVEIGKTAAAHLRERWTGALPEGQVHLMVQCMEAWFFADKTTLAAYYGDGFKESALPANRRIEEIPKKDLLDALARATKDTGKKRYHKTRHGFDILERLDPQLVRQCCPSPTHFSGFLCSLSTSSKLRATIRSSGEGRLQHFLAPLPEAGRSGVFGRARLGTV